jgi:hypothetical protein
MYAAVWLFCSFALVISQFEQKSRTETLDGAIRIITKFVQCGVANGVFDDLLLRWLDDFFESKSIREVRHN